MITANGVVVIAVTAMKSGADDYLNKPVSLGGTGSTGSAAGGCVAQARADRSWQESPEVPATQTTANATVNNDSPHHPDSIAGWGAPTNGRASQANQGGK
jgi:DNA-binding NtrC family response regulator